MISNSLAVVLLQSHLILYNGAKKSSWVRCFSGAPAELELMRIEARHDALDLNIVSCLETVFYAPVNFLQVRQTI